MRGVKDSEYEGGQLPRPTLDYVKAQARTRTDALDQVYIISESYYLLLIQCRHLISSSSRLTVDSNWVKRLVPHSLLYPHLSLPAGDYRSDVCALTRMLDMY